MVEVHALRIPEKNQVHEYLESYIRRLGLRGGLIVGIGALEHVKLGFVDPVTRTYSVLELKARETSLEVSSLIGNYIARQDGSVSIHVHVTVGNRQETYAGHLLSGVVNPVLEVFLLEIGEPVREAFKYRLQ